MKTNGLRINEKILSLLLLSLLFAMPVYTHTGKAQVITDGDNRVVPVDALFFGDWTFDHAQAQERPANSQQSYTTRSVLQDEFWQKTYLLDIPTRIAFMSAFMAHISHPSWSSPVVAVINPANSGKLEFRNFRKNPEDYNKLPELSEIDLYPVIMPAYSLTLNGGTMSLQCNYTYLDASGKHIEGVLTVYYKRF